MRSEKGSIVYVKQPAIASGQPTASAMRLLDRPLPGRSPAIGGRPEPPTEPRDAAGMLIRIRDRLDNRPVVVTPAEGGRTMMRAMLRQIGNASGPADGARAPAPAPVAFVPAETLSARLSSVEPASWPVGDRHSRSPGIRATIPTMAIMQVDPGKVHAFVDSAAFYAWLAAHHDNEDEVWIKIHKVGSGLPSITPAEAIDAALCWGWIDAIRKSLDQTSYLQRYTRRRAPSIWSQVNVGNVERLIRDGRMTRHGLAQAEAAKADGRWARAYGSGKNLPIPSDLQSAIEAVPEARAMLARLNGKNRFALAFRMHNLKTAAARERRIAEYVAMLSRGETLYPQRDRQENR